MNNTLKAINLQQSKKQLKKLKYMKSNMVADANNNYPTYFFTSTSETNTPKA